MYRMCTRFYLVLGIVLLGTSSCQPTDPAPESSELDRLRQDLVDVCETYVAQIETKHDLGVVGMEELNYARIQLLQAQLNLEESNMATQSQPAPHDDNGARQTTIELIEEAIRIRERDLNESQVRLEAGLMVDPYDVELAQIRLGEVQLQLATAKNDRAAIVATLEALIQYWDKAVAKSERLFDAGLAHKPYVDAQVAAIETRIRLVEAKRDNQ